MLIYDRIKLSGKSNLVVRSRGWGAVGRGWGFLSWRLQVTPLVPGSWCGIGVRQGLCIQDGKIKSFKSTHTPNYHRNTYYVLHWSLHLLTPSLPRLYFCLSDLILTLKMTMNISELDFICISDVFCSCLGAKLCLTLLWPYWLYCSLPGSSVQDILQARILDWVSHFLLGESSQPRDWTLVPCNGKQILHHEPPGKPRELGS